MIKILNMAGPNPPTPPRRPRRQLRAEPVSTDEFSVGQLVRATLVAAGGAQVYGAVIGRDAYTVRVRLNLEQIRNSANRGLLGYEDIRNGIIDVEPQNLLKLPALRRSPQP